MKLFWMLILYSNSFFNRKQSRFKKDFYKKLQMKKTYSFKNGKLLGQIYLKYFYLWE